MKKHDLRGNGLDGLAPLILAWYDENRRDLPFRENPTPYRVWVSEVMLQQTRVEAVVPYYLRFMERFPNVRSVEEAPEEELLKHWEGLGYYSRVKNMRRAAAEVCLRYDGELPADYAALRALPGFGEYTAGAVASIAFGIPVPAVDGNVKRVMMRVLGDRREIGEPAVAKELRGLLADVMDRERPGDFNQALMELGAVLCLPNGAPICGRCPLLPLCEAAREGKTGEIPGKRKKPVRRIDERTILLVSADERIALRKRSEKGVLSGLYELPGLPGFCGEREVRAAVSEWGAEVGEISPLPESRHIFTHIEWRMRAYRVETAPFSPPEGFVLANETELAEKYPLPSAFSAYRSLMFPK